MVENKGPETGLGRCIIGTADDSRKAGRRFNSRVEHSLEGRWRVLSDGRALTSTPA